LFRDVLGQTDAEISARVDDAYQRLFHGDPGVQAVFFELTDGSAYVLDIAEQDIGLDGMGYGLFASVEVNRRSEFDALLKFTQDRMLIRSGPHAGYYSRGCTPEFACDDATSPDASAFLVTSLILADERWGSTGSHDYGGMARALLDTMLTKADDPDARAAGVTNLFDESTRLIVEAPTGDGARLTSPPYHMPAFFEVWARFQPERAREWTAMAAASRVFWRRAAHETTGLMPRIATFDGVPVEGELGWFDWESARTSMHVGLDQVWFRKDTWQTGHSERLLGFFRSQGISSYVDRYTIDGVATGLVHSPSIVAMNGMAAMASPESRDFIEAVWQLSVPEGQWRYYDGMLYLLSLLALGGRLHADF
jgi:oligosaccharide reducing-end xylanase